jgi:malate permease and related proteins
MPDITLPLLLTAVLPVFLLMGTGGLLRHLRILTPESDHVVVSLAVSVTYPCLIVSNIVGNDSLRVPANVWLPLTCGALFMIVGGALAWLAAPLFGLKNGAVRRTFALACSVQNYGYLPIPIMREIFPDGGWPGVLFIYCLGIELVLWTLGVWLMDPHTKGAAKNVLNPVVLSIVIGLGLNFFPWREWAAPGQPASWVLPGIQRATVLLGECAIPLGLVIVGATLYDLMSRPGWHSDAGAAIGGVLMRLAVLPAMMLGALALMPAASEDFRHIVAVQAAMPAAVFPMIIARRYGGNEATAMRVIVMTTLASLFTIPFAVKLALHWAG